MEQNEKHFFQINVINSTDNLNETTLNDNSFADITFDNFYGYGIRRISNKAFGKSAETLTHFWCNVCKLQDSPSNYSIWSTLSQFTKLESVTIGLYITEIPSNAIKTIDGHNSTLKYLTIKSDHNFTIKANAFQNLANLTHLQFRQTTISKIEKGAFNFTQKNHRQFNLFLSDVHLNGDAFKEGSFDGVQRPVHTSLYSTNIGFISESAFKTVLNNSESQIYFYYNSFINCEDCRNYWLITGKKESQIKSPHCRGNLSEILFDENVKSKLMLKCNK